VTDDPVVSDEECWNIARRVGWSALEIEHSLVIEAIRAGVKRGLEMAAACGDRHPGCCQHVADDARALAARLEKEGR
jgi:hypothetical protein